MLEQPATTVHVAHPREVGDVRAAAIAFRGVGYEYPGRRGPALDAVDLTLEPGLVTALVGESGSGKSTIARLLMRVADPIRGSIACGGRDLRGLDIDEWRAQIAWVPQRPTLFTGTVEENFRLGAPQASAAALREAVCAAGLEEVIARLPDRLNTVIGSHGA